MTREREQPKGIHEATTENVGPPGPVDHIVRYLNAALAERYIIERELGRGGMGAVYLAEDLKHRRKVAVKIVRPDVAVGLGKDRFLREIEIAARLAHPHILPLHDSGTAGDLLYYVMPYVEGPSLRDRLRREQRLQPHEALRITRQVASALDHAHSCGVVHRDIKPENILLHAGEAVIADFGIARAISAAGQGEVTATGVMVGTPAYMSPEQAGGAADIDGRSDIYSLGCVLHEMLAGSPPFAGGSAQEILRRHLLDPPPGLRKVLPAIPESVEQAVAKALAKTPGDRFETAGQFVEAVAHALEVPTSPPWPLSVGGRRWLMAAALALVGVTVPLFLWKSDRWSGPGTKESPARSHAGRPVVAVLPFENASPDLRDGYFAQGLHQDIISQLGIITGMTVIDRSSVLRYRDESIPTGTIATQLGATFVLRGSLKKDSTGIRFTARLIDTRDNAVVWSHEFTDDLSAASLFGMQSSLAYSVAEALQVRISSLERGRLNDRPTESGTAYSLYLRARELPYDSDAEANAAAAELLVQATSLDPEFAPGLAELALVHWNSSYLLGGPDTKAESGLALARQAIELEPDLPAGHRALGLIYLDQGRLNHAAEALTRLLDLRPGDGEALLLLGWIRFLRGNLAEASRLWTDSRSIDPLNAMCYRDLGLLFRVLGDEERAAYWGKLALTVDPSIADVRRVRVLLREHRAREALSEAERLLSARPRLRLATELAAQAALEAKDYPRARQYLEELHRGSPGDWDPWGLTHRTSYAHVLRELGDLDRARELLAATLRDALNRLKEGDERPGIRREIAAIYARQGARDQAYEWFARAVDSGWRLEEVFPSPLFEQIRRDAPFLRSMSRMQTEIQRDGEHVIREQINAPIR